MLEDIVLENICVSFGEKQVLKDFSHVFKAGTLTVIEGPSGCGKTTVMNLIAGTVKPDSGTVTGVPGRIACVYQEDRLCEDFNAVSNVRLVTGKTRSKETVISHLRELGIREDLNRPVRVYSGGMKRRVAIARAMLYDGDVVLLDEPFKGLDETLKKDVMDYVLKMTAGKTVIMVTHDLSEAEYMGGELLQLTREQ